MNVYFYELNSKTARADLAALEQSLKSSPSVVSTRLLQSLEQEGLFLLIVEAKEKPALLLPENCRVWSFTSPA
ncbi:MAG: hypothetical protein KC422_21235 [Trueperaceae bacterium]|nr:hypothetical protein [Trueperaceae bacterium]